MSGRSTSGTSGPSLGDQVLALFSFISSEIAVQKHLGKRVEVPDIFLPDIRDQPDRRAQQLGGV